MTDKKRILVVDDEKEFVEFIKSVLEEQGYVVISAYDGKEGLRQIRRRIPDLLILDLSMPGMGGIELYFKICSTYGRTPFPVMVLTGIGQMADFFEKALVDAFLEKPFKVTDLLQRIDQLLTGQLEPVLFLRDEACPEEEKIEMMFQHERFKVKRIDSLDNLKEQASSNSPDAILTAYETEDGTVEDFIRKARGLPQFRQTPIIVYSRAGFSNGEAGVLKAGANQFVGKPDDLKPLFHALRQVLRKSSL